MKTKLLSVLGVAMLCAWSTVAQTLTSQDIVPDGVSIVPGSYTSSGPGSFTIIGGGVGIYRRAGDTLHFASEQVTGDFDKRVRLVSLVANPVSDPVEDWTRAGLMVREELDPISPSLKIFAASPEKQNLVVVAGRAIRPSAPDATEGASFTEFSKRYAGVKETLPNQWLRIKRVGDYFAFYVSKDGSAWALVGDRYQKMASTLYVGAYAAASRAEGDTTAEAEFADYGTTPVSDTTAPTVVSTGTIDKTTVGVKFSELLDSASATTLANYTLSQGTVTAAKMGIGGDSVYLTVSGLTADTYSVTVTGVKDSAGNALAASATVNGSVTPWISADIGSIQDPANRPTPGDDPGSKGSAVAVSSGSEPEVEIVGGGSNCWDPGDYVHYLHREFTGDFDMAVEVIRYDRAANTAGWGNSGIHIRPELYRTDDPTIDPGQFDVGSTEWFAAKNSLTKVPNFQLVTYMEASAPGRSGIAIWRSAPGGNYGAGGTIGIGTEIGGITGGFGRLRAGNSAGDVREKTTSSQAIWLRVSRTGTLLKSFVSYDGLTWTPSQEQDRPDLPAKVLIGFSTHNDSGGSAPPNNAYGGNTTPGQNESNYSVQKIKIHNLTRAAGLVGTDIAPEGVAVVAGSTTDKGNGAYSVIGGGAGIYRRAGDTIHFANEVVTGDFDKRVRLVSLVANPVSDPVEDWTRAGLMVREALDPISPSLKIFAASPEKQNLVVVAGRAIRPPVTDPPATEGNSFTEFSKRYAGVKETLPNQWLRIKRVGHYFAFYVSKDGTSWTQIADRYQAMASQLYVGLYAAGSRAEGDTTAEAEFADYGTTPVSDTTAPTVVSTGTIDKTTVGVKFSELLDSASATTAGNYTLSEGTVSSVRMGIGGDSVYLTVSGLTSDTYSVTVSGVKDSAGNALAASATVNGSVTAWVSADIGAIQNPASRPTPGDDPGRVGSAVAVSSDANPEVEIIGGGSNCWDPGDYVHYLHREFTGDFDMVVEVKRYDRPANTAGWGNSGIHIRPELYRTDDPSIDPGQFDVGSTEWFGAANSLTKVPNFQLVTYMEASAPGRSGIAIWRSAAGGNYGAGGTIGIGTEIGGLVGGFGHLRAANSAGDLREKTSESQNIWLRVTRAGTLLQSFVSYDGVTWAPSQEQDRADLPAKVLVGFSTHNDTGGSAPPNNAYGGNTTPYQNESNYSVQRIRLYPAGPAGLGPIAIRRDAANGNVIVTWPGRGTLESASSVLGPWTPVPNAASGVSIAPAGAQTFYRLNE